jgi:hypothetical protein
MRLLLDTHTLIWWLINDPTLSVEAKEAIADPDNIVLNTFTRNIDKCTQLLSIILRRNKL